MRDGKKGIEQGNKEQHQYYKDDSAHDYFYCRFHKCTAEDGLFKVMANQCISCRYHPHSDGQTGGNNQKPRPLGRGMFEVFKQIANDIPSYPNKSLAY